MALSVFGIEFDVLENIGEIAFKLVLALILGGMIGFEREFSRKAAGLRTNILICVGAAAFTMVSLVLADRDGEVDISRVAAQIVTGIGFLGAGTIIQARGEVHGLTSAATIWVVAAIGLAVGSGYYSLALVTTGLVIIALLILGWVGKSITEEQEVRRYEITIENSATALEKVHDLLRGAGKVQATDVAKEGEAARVTARIAATEGEHGRLAKTLAPLPEVRKVRSE